MMNTKNLYQEKLHELINQCQSIDALVLQGGQFPLEEACKHSQELADLRLKQRETIATLHSLEVYHADEWENIGLGG